jgi:hypothetical protein
MRERNRIPIGRPGCRISSLRRNLPCAALRRASKLDVARNTDGIEVPPLRGSAHCAPRLTVMPTIAKPALDCQGLDIIEIAYAAFRGIPEFEAT